MADDPLPELYFATVRAMGTDLKATTDQLSTTLTAAGYHVPKTVRLSDEMQKAALCRRYLAPTGSSEYVTRNCLMTAGDGLRTFVGSDAIAYVAVDRLIELRTQEAKVARRRGMRGIAWILRSLMHEAEVSTLRDVLGSHFFVVSVYSDETRRADATRRQLGRTHNLNDELTLDEQVEDLLARDQGRDYRFEDDLKRMQRNDPDLAVARLSIEKTFFMADLFLDGDRNVATDIDRFVRQIFSDPFGVATLDEVGMAHAFTAAYQSSITSRRVGAAIMVGASLICTGRNDLPKAGGGQQSDSVAAAPGDLSNGLAVGKVRRRREAEALYNERSDVARDFLVRMLSSTEWLVGLAAVFPGVTELSEAQRSTLVDSTLGMGFVQDSRIFDLIEFNPSVHAEMSAVTTAARLGFAIAEGLLYTTTFPCHECTRHIISSGLRRVVYLEPYAKSRAAELFADQIRLSRSQSEEVDDGSANSPVDYVAFMGIAPRRHAELFSWLDREGEKGELVDYQLDRTSPIRPSIEAPVSTELAAARWRSRLKDQKLVVKDLAQRLERGAVQSRTTARNSRAPRSSS